MKLKEILEYLEDEQLIMIQIKELKSDIIKKENMNDEWQENKVKKIETGIAKGYKGYLFTAPDRSFVKIEIE